MPVQLLTGVKNWQQKTFLLLLKQTGPVNVLGTDKREVDCFRLLSPVGFLAWITNETNCFARQVQAVKGTHAGLKRTWIKFVYL